MQFEEWGNYEHRWIHFAHKPEDFEDQIPAPPSKGLFFIHILFLMTNNFKDLAAGPGKSILRIMDEAF